MRAPACSRRPVRPAAFQLPADDVHGAELALRRRSRVGLRAPPSVVRRREAPARQQSGHSGVVPSSYERLRPARGAEGGDAALSRAAGLELHVKRRELHVLSPNKHLLKGRSTRHSNGPVKTVITSRENGGHRFEVSTTIL